VVALDVNEILPEVDPAGITAITGAKLIREAAILLARWPAFVHLPCNEVAGSASAASSSPRAWASRTSGFSHYPGRQSVRGSGSLTLAVRSLQQPGQTAVAWSEAGW